MREGDLQIQKEKAEERLAAIEKEREAEIAQGQIAVSNALSEVDRLTSMCNELTIVRKSEDISFYIIGTELSYDVQLAVAYSVKSCYIPTV